MTNRLSRRNPGGAGQDGGGGYALVETDNQADLADLSSKFGFIAEYTIHPVIEMDQAAQLLQQGADFRESIS